LFYQTKSRFYLELDSKIQASKDIVKEKEHRRIYVLDETIIKSGSEYIWLWVAIEPKNKEILGISIPKERNMIVAERFLSKIVEKYGDHPVSTDGGTWYLSIHKRASF
jgi:putative transposase